MIANELGFLPFDGDGGKLLFDLLTDRHRLRTTITTTNLAFSLWLEALADERLSTVPFDRLGHHAHIHPPNSPPFWIRDVVANWVADPAGRG